jgi:hypothetical protein
MNGGGTASLIDVLWPAFAGAPFSLAPERREELQTLIVQRNINFQLDRETHEMRFEGADLFGGLGLVCVGMNGLERLWAHTYGIIHIYRRFQAIGFGQPLDLCATEEGRIAGLLMDWAIDGELRENPAPWPNDLPHPEAQPTDAQGLLTNELFLGATGFAVLHEIGHVALQHHGTDLPQDVLHRHEFEADEWAYNWVMSRWRDYRPQHPLIFKKRCTLIACLFALIAITHVRSPRDVSTSDHPNTIDRLLRFLDAHANEDNGLDSGLAWAAASTGIGLHLNQISSDPWPTFNSFREHFIEIRRRFPGL